MARGKNQKMNQKSNVIQMDRLQDRTASDPGAAEHAQMRTQCPQEPPVKANEEQVGKIDHRGSQRTGGSGAKRKSGQGRGKRVA